MRLVKRNITLDMFNILKSKKNNLRLIIRLHAM